MYYDDRMGAEEEGMDDEDFDSEDALFFDNNDLANRVWEENDWRGLNKFSSSEWCLALI